MLRPTRLTAASLSSVMALTLIVVVAAPEAAHAGGPSVPLPDTAQTAVTNPTSKPPRPADQASSAALQGNQPVSTTPPPAGGGTPTASPLSPSATWQVSPHTGDFTWSYPLRVPPAAGGLEPDLALSYASSTVDGRTSTSNNQASWIGEGWDMHPGFIERIYGACADDDVGGTTPPKTGDLCWRSDNAMSSRAGMLIAESGRLWRAKSDDGARIERLDGIANGDDNGEHWKVTTVDGTQYFYGSRPEAKSTWTVPVFGDDAQEPCHGASFAASRCTQAWRWALDKVIDPHGNMITYSYEVETNKYGANLKDDGVSYIRGGTLRLIEYGLRADGSTSASGQVEFFTASRCVPGSECVQSKKDNWPDVPWTSHCDASTCLGNYAPTFWTTKRLERIVTRVRGATGFTDVDSWKLEHAFPAPGDQEKASLWLKSIVHTGHVGGTEALPAVTFEGTAKPNRVNFSTGVGPLNRYRITGIVSESGGTIDVFYAAPDCAEGSSMPANQESNTLRCFPVRWVPQGGNERVEYFHKYVVSAVVESDSYDGTIEQRTSYHYLDGAAWHFDTSEFTKDDKKTYSEFRGFGRVRMRKGNAGDPAGPVSEIEQRFYRGMDGDRLPGGARRSVKVTDSRGGARTDSDWFAGFEFESARLNGVNGAVVSTTVTTPDAQGPHATRGDMKSYLVRPRTVVEHTALAGTAWRRTQTETLHDDRGQVTEIDDSGDLDLSDDDQCTRKSYARNTNSWILSLHYRTWTVAGSCEATGAETLTETRIGYDGLAIGTAPSAGTATLTEEDGVVTATRVYDVHGRVTSSKDALGNETTTEYTPGKGGPTTKTVVTNALDHVTSTTLAPAWGSPTLVVDPNLRRTETTYDALGRASAVWLPNRKRSQGETASAKFSYRIRTDGPVVVTTWRLNARGDYTMTKQIYDPLMRLRQVQAPASGGGRLLTDTRYDSQGRAYFTSQPYFHNSALDDALWVASEVDKLGATMMTFDGAGRVVATAFRGGGVEKWRTTQAHEGDRVHVTPPRGGTPTTTVKDARGRIIEVRQGAAPDITRYTYTRAGDLESIVDSMGNRWRYGYDRRGNLIRTEDPDKGPTDMEYDLAQRMISSKDARQLTVHYGYDELGRKTSLKRGTDTLASWVYDTALFGKGLLASSARHVGTETYRVSVASYNQLNKPVSVSLTVPEREQTLAGTYTTEMRYDYDGGLASKTMPAIGGLPAEGVVHERDALGLPKVTRGGFNGQTIHYASDTVYTRQGEIARMQFGDPEGTKRAWQSFYYDAHTRRLDRAISDVEAAAPMQADVRYTYDPAGNITSIVDAPLDRTADTQCFRYDYLRRLTRAWTPSTDCASEAPLGGPAPYNQAYTYDKSGNRLSDSTRTYSYTAHRLRSVTEGTKVDQYDYDLTGNMTVRPGQTLEWDAEGRVSKVSAAGKDTTFVYDADGTRLIRRTPEATTLYLDGQELTLKHGNGALLATRYYTHGDKTVAVRTPGALHWLVGDHQGSPHLAVNADTMTVTQRRQTPFGAPRGATAGMPGERGFVGGTEDISTGLVHVGAREYDAGLGRFISVDPVMGDEPQLMNAYAYSNNSPVTFSDPTGLYCDSCDYYAHTKGESSVWSPPVQRSSFCDSCEYYSRKNNTKSAWNQPTYNKSIRPTVFDDSEKLNARLAAERKAQEEARRKAEECARSFLCGVRQRLKEVTNSSVFKWTAVGLSVLGMFGCVVCGAIGMGMSALGALSACMEGDGVECAAGVGSLALGGAAMGFAKVATNVWLKGAEMGTSNLRRVRAGGYIVRGASYVPRAVGVYYASASVIVDSVSAGGGLKDIKADPNRRAI